VGNLVLTAAVRNALKILFEILQGKRQLDNPRRSWKDNIRMSLKEENGKIWTAFV
jgi:hypothetical protein